MIKKEELFKDGVDKKTYFQSREYYLSCPECSEPFVRGKTEPCLLQCGHVCCEQCLFQIDKPCGCCNLDHVPKKLKIKGYTKLFLAEEQFQPLEEEIFYDFAITMGPITCSLNRQSSNLTFKQLLTQFKDFKEFTETLGETAQLSIRSKVLQYKNIKETKLIEKKDILLNNKTNKINVLTRYLGGLDQPAQ